MGFPPWQFKCLCLSGAFSQPRKMMTQTLRQFPSTVRATVQESSLSLPSEMKVVFRLQRKSGGEWGCFCEGRGEGVHPPAEGLLSTFACLVEVRLLVAGSISTAI